MTKTEQGTLCNQPHCTSSPIQNNVNLPSIISYRFSSPPLAAIMSIEAKQKQTANNLNECAHFESIADVLTQNANGLRVLLTEYVGVPVIIAAFNYFRTYKKHSEQGKRLLRVMDQIGWLFCFDHRGRKDAAVEQLAQWPEFTEALHQIVIATHHNRAETTLVKALRVCARDCAIHECPALEEVHADECIY